MSDCGHAFSDVNGCPHCGATARAVQVERFANDERHRLHREHEKRVCEEFGHIYTEGTITCIRCGEPWHEDEHNLPF